VSEEQAAEETTAEPEAEHPLVAALRQGLPDLEEAVLSEARGMTLIALSPADRIVDACRFLKEASELEFTMLVDIVAVDYWDEEPRFGLTYTLHSMSRNERVYLKVRVGSEDPVLPTLTSVWSGSNWMEREVFDMFGVRFQGHPDLRKVLTPDDLEGHPLRKDFPLGNVDIWPEGAGTNTAH